MKNIIFRRLLYFLSVVSIVVTVVSTVTLPVLVRWYSNHMGLTTVGFNVMIFIYLTLMPFLTILIAVMKLSRNLLKDNPFCENSIMQLKAISICAFIDFIMYFIGTLFIFRNLVCFILMIATMMVFLISAVIKELINNGIVLQEENELMI